MFVRVLCLFLCLQSIYGFTKVLVPSIYHEFINGYPDWISNPEILKKYNYSVFLYQKMNSSEPNYVKNRGTEGGVYLRYIVDHYDNLPDVMMFTHAHPQDHQPDWIHFLDCVQPSISYVNINFQYLYRYSSYWKNDREFWLEQCMRDILKILWGLEDNQEEFNKRLSPNSPIFIALSCGNQFIVSKNTILKRPLSVYKKILLMVNERTTCHEGPLDFDNLYATHRKRDVPEEPPEGYGREIQGMAMEHLSHLIFGYQDLDGEFPDQSSLCQSFYPNCHKSPCGNLDYNPPQKIKTEY